MNFKLRIKKGDTVKVLSGKDKGKTGKILRVFPELGKVIVENVNMHTRFERSRQPNVPAKQVTAAYKLAVSKVQLVDPNSGNPSRIGYKVSESGVKTRFAKQSGKSL